MCFFLVFGGVMICSHMWKHLMSTENIFRVHMQSVLRTALWGIQGCLSSTPRKQINWAQGRVSRAPTLGLPLHSLPCCFNVRICNIQTVSVFNTESALWLLHIHPAALQYCIILNQIFCSVKKKAFLFYFRVQSSPWTEMLQVLKGEETCCRLLFPGDVCATDCFQIVDVTCL